MSVNHHMHPRNIYRKPPNFVKLALEYPEFKNFVKQDLSGKISVDFKERDAVLALTKALLQSDFGLSLTLPENRLVPTLPLRLNYILWLEDLLLLKNLARKEPVHGIDIGTGAACIYPLLAAKKNNWSMLATEVDDVSAEYANSNVAANKLADLIKVEKETSDNVLLDVMKEQTGDFDFCMCNPPFFSSEDELQCSSERNPPRNAPTGCKSELVAPGGEVAFVKRIIDESIQLGTKVRVYTTMLGKKTSLKDLQTYLVEKGRQMPLSVGTTEFCQGFTTRWGLAWSFAPGVALPDLMKARKKNEKKKNPAVVTMKNCTLSNAVAKLNLLFKDLEIQSKLIKENPTKVEMSIIAKRNTWSHQRRKRRANRRQNNEESNNGVNDPDKDGDSNACKKSRIDDESVNLRGSGDQITQVNVDSKPEKVGSIPGSAENDGKLKASNVMKELEGRKKHETVSNCSQDGEEKPSNMPDVTGKSEHSTPADENDGLDDFIGNKWAEIDTLPLLTADVLLQNLGKDVMVALSLAEGCLGGWECVHQVRQIIINRVDSKTVN